MLRGRSRFMYLRGSVDERFRLFRPRYSDDESLSICEEEALVSTQQTRIVVHRGPTHLLL